MRGGDKERDNRIHDEIIVDCNGDEEVGMSWFYYLQENMEFPFKAKMEIKHRDGTTKTTKIEVLSIETKNERSWDLRLEVVEAKQTKIQRIELSDLIDVDADEKTIECLEDWKYFNNF